MSLARVLTVHNAYRQRGGEDAVVEAESALLLAHGHECRLLLRHNKELESLFPLTAAIETVWSRRSSAILARAIKHFSPDVIHVHNTFPRLSPSVYWTADRMGVAVVQTLHNFRLVCAQAMFLRHSRLCEDCLGKWPWRGVFRRCYRGSFAQTAVLAAMLGLHRSLGTYRRKVTRYIALNQYCRSRFVAAGLPADRIVVKPNFVDMHGPSETGNRSGFLFVGRLSPEKGLSTLAQVAQILTGAMFVAIGEGPGQNDLSGLANVQMTGFLQPDAVSSAMGRAAALLLPSICNESFPRTLVEAFAHRLPVIASRIGPLAELVKDGRTGMLFDPGNGKDLARKLRWASAHPERLRQMGAAARNEYESFYAPEINYQRLVAIYDEAIQEKKKHVK